MARKNPSKEPLLFLSVPHPRQGHRPVQQRLQLGPNHDRQNPRPAADPSDSKLPPPHLNGPHRLETTPVLRSRLSRRGPLLRPNRSDRRVPVINSPPSKRLRKQLRGLHRKKERPHPRVGLIARWKLSALQKRTKHPPVTAGQAGFRFPLEKHLRLRQRRPIKQHLNPQELLEQW